MKGVEIGKTYYRQGSTNTEALSLDIIKINNWLQSLPEIEENESTQTAISNFLKRLLTQRERLSEILPEIYTFAGNNNLVELKEFCEFEIKGFDIGNIEIMNKVQTEHFKYRVQIIKMSLNKIVKTYYQTADQVKQALDNADNFYDIPYFFKDAIIPIERFLNKTEGFVSITMKVKDVLPEYDKDYPAYGYLFNNNFISLYENIRQRLIDIIMELK